MRTHLRSLLSLRWDQIRLAIVVLSITLLGGAGQALAITSITWNPDTFHSFPNSDIPANCGTRLYYPRMVKCPNGDMLLFAQSGNGINGGCILYCRTSDGAWSFGPWQVLKRWGNRDWFGTTINAQHANANPLVVGNEILLCYQVRAATTLDDTNTGIEVIRSSDNGNTWSEPVVALRAQIWEPRMVDMGAGVLRCYYTRYNDINFVQSPNNGVSWQGANTSAENIRMPSPVKLKNGTLAIAGESGNTAQGPQVYDSTHRRELVAANMDGYGPQMLQIPHGETILATNGKDNGVQGVWVFIGTSGAASFGRVTRPFGNTTGIWPDVTLKASDIVIVSAGTSTGLELIHGRITF